MLSEFGASKPEHVCCLSMQRSKFLFLFRQAKHHRHIDINQTFIFSNASCVGVCESRSAEKFLFAAQQKCVAETTQLVIGNHLSRTSLFNISRSYRVIFKLLIKCFDFDSRLLTLKNHWSLQVLLSDKYQKFLRWTFEKCCLQRQREKRWRCWMSKLQIRNESEFSTLNGFWRKYFDEETNERRDLN